VRIEIACQADQEAIYANQPALEKIRILPEITAMLSRQNALEAVLDPDINFLQTLRFMLEPLEDGSLPGFAVQRGIFAALLKLPVRKETLISSKMGGLVLFYTRSKLPELSVRRLAETLVEEWSRPILARTDDANKRHIQSRYFDRWGIIVIHELQAQHSS